MENNEQREAKEIRTGLMTICGVCILGYIIGRSSSNSQLAIRSYEKGVSDTLSSIVFKQK